MMSEWQENNQFNLEGETLGNHYVLEKKVGQGGMAWVYRARHQLLGGNVAVKVLFPQLAENENIRTRFLREAKLQYQLEHPHIVRVLDFINEKGMVGFVSEWCGGGDLVDWLEGVGLRPLSPGEIRSLFLPLLDAMHLAHQHGVVHRDLKPHNIMLHQRGELLLPKVTDFGIAKQTQEQGLTATGMVVGTVYYMSPEQLYESKSVDLRSDIYSLGIILYQMISGRLPFVGESPGIFMKILEGTPPTIENIPPEIQSILDRCLAKKPEQRFANCMELRAALDACLSPPEPIVPPGHPVTDSAREQALGGFNSAISRVSFGGVSQPNWSPENVAITPQSDSFTYDAPPSVDVSAETAFLPTGSAPTSTPKKKGLSLGLIFFMLLLVGGAAAGGWYWWKQAGLNVVEPDDPVQRRVVIRQQPRPRPPVVERGRTLPPKNPVVVDGGAAQPLPEKRHVAPERRIPQVRRIRPKPPKRRFKRRIPPRRFVRQKPPIRRVRPRRRPNLRLVRKCRHGVGLACYILGMKEERKKHWAIDYRVARRYYRKACRQRIPKACSALGRLMYKGKGGPRNYRKARRAYLFACRARDSFGCRELGWLLQKGKGGLRRPRRARFSYGAACELGDSIGCNLLGKMFQNGSGGRVSYLKALIYYRKACNLKNSVGCYNIGLMYQNGLSVYQSSERALVYFRKACRMKFGQSCYFAAGTLYDVVGKRGCRRVNRLLRRACKLKYRKACRKTCSSYNRGRSRSRSWLEDTP